MSIPERDLLIQFISQYRNDWIHVPDTDDDNLKQAFYLVFDNLEKLSPESLAMFTVEVDTTCDHVLQKEPLFLQFLKNNTSLVIAHMDGVFMEFVAVYEYKNTVDKYRMHIWVYNQAISNQLIIEPSYYDSISFPRLHDQIVYTGREVYVRNWDYSKGDLTSLQTRASAYNLTLRPDPNMEWIWGVSD